MKLLGSVRKLFFKSVKYSKGNIMKVITVTLYEADNQTLEENVLNKRTYNIIESKNIKYPFTFNYDFENSVNALIEQGIVFKTPNGLNLSDKGIIEAKRYYNRTWVIKFSDFVRHI